MKKSIYKTILSAAVTVMLVLTLIPASAAAAASEQFAYYLESAAYYGLIPEGVDMKQNVTLGNLNDFMLCFVENKCYFDADEFLRSKGMSVPYDSARKAAELQKALGLDIAAGLSENVVLTQEQIAYYVCEYIRVFTAPFSPLFYDVDAPFTRYNFLNHPYAVYSMDVMTALMSEIISLSEGNELSRNKYAARGYLTAEQLAAMSFMLSTMTLPKDMSGKYPGGITTYSDTDRFIENILDSVITANMTSEQKVKAVYDYMIHNFTHSDDAMPILLRGGEEEINPVDTERSLFTPIMLSGKGTCDVFASGLRLLLLRLGFECNYVSGQYVNRNGSQSGHGWNQVKIDDEWYWLDVDVEGTVFRRDGYEAPIYFLYMKKDDYWLTNHDWNRGEYPACDSAKYPTAIPARTYAAPDKPSSWAVEHVQEAALRELSTDELAGNYPANTTRAEFCRAAVRFLEVYSGENIDAILYARGLSLGSFTDTSDAGILAANALGIVAGVGGGRFAPNESITREQAAVLLSNTLTALGEDTYSGASASFADLPSVSDWAISGVNAIFARAIMSGTGNNMFSPKECYTHEQTIITLNNMYNHLLTANSAAGG
jgi:hypothetical protein